MSAWLFVALAISSLFACRAGEEGRQEGSAVAPAAAVAGAPLAAIRPGSTPRLIVLLVVDQMRADYLSRFRPLLSGGLAWLLDEGQVFHEAHQWHAATETAPGHATIATGNVPAHHGIISNYWYDREEGDEVYAARVGGVASPERLLLPTLAERLKRAWPLAKVVSIAGKDRSAVLMAGRRADAVLWYSARSGDLETSSFYGGGEVPAWSDSLNKERWVDRWFGEDWNLSFDPATARSFGVEPVDFGVLTKTFPRALGSAAAQPGTSYYQAIYSSPFLDSFVAEGGRRAITGEALGRDEVPDLLALGFSALDAVGHAFGPDAPETLDVILRLDRTLAELFDFIDQEVGLDHVVFALSADHGVGEVPELRARRGEVGGRFARDEIVCIQRLGLRVAREFDLGPGWMPELAVFDEAEITRAGARRAAVVDSFRQGLAACPSIARVIDPAELEGALLNRGGGISSRTESESAHLLGDQMLTLFANSFFQGRSEDLLILLQPDTLATSAALASHGTPQRHDTWVPMVFRIPGAQPRQFQHEVHTIDIAPTLAEIAGLPRDGMDGISQLSLIQ